MGNKEKKERLSDTFISALFIGLAVGAGVTYFGFRKEVKFAERMEIVRQCEEFMSENGFDIPETLDDSEILNAYLSMYDKYTFYNSNENVSKKNVLDFVNASQTAYGMGFAISFDKDWRVVFDDIDEGKPAAKLGLKKGDILISIDDRDVTEDINAAKKLTGKDGTSSSVVIERDERLYQLDFIRKNEENPYDDSFKDEMLGKTLYIRIPSFDSFYSLGLDEIAHDSVIVDLRDNSGGETAAAVSVAGSFVDKGSVVMHQNDGEIKEFNVENGIQEKKPIVVLVNEKTASAAEIMTALLKQNGENVTIVGETTFGKGIFQADRPFLDGWLRWTNGYFTVGDWDCWQGKGIEPDVVVKSGDWLRGSDEDVQLKKALEILGQK